MSYSVAQVGLQLIVILLRAPEVLGDDRPPLLILTFSQFLDQLKRSRNVFLFGGSSGQVSLDPRVKL